MDFATHFKFPSDSAKDNVYDVQGQMAPALLVQSILPKLTREKYF